MSRLARRWHRPGQPVVRGDIDRALNGLVTGWLFCPHCDTSVLAHLQVAGAPVSGTATPSPRPDVPGGQGFVIRFAPTKRHATSMVTVRAHCPQHQDVALQVRVDAAEWDVPALGQIEHVSWPHISGWVATFATASTDVVLSVGENACIPVRGTVDRRDVQAFLGEAGVRGFQIDLGSRLGYAVPDGTTLALAADRHVLADGVVRDSPLGAATAPCSRPARPDWQAARARFSVTPPAPADGSWSRELEALGIVDDAPTTRQWADFLTHAGLSGSQTASWLAARALHGLGVPCVDPRPHVNTPAESGSAPLDLPARVTAWAERLLPEPVLERPMPLPATVDAVCVAGLVGHRSGLGQNAAHSIRVLTDAGLHVCEAPFFPAPGGWNARLGPEGEDGGRLADHAVLLHLPVDRVVQSLSAQPALLASPRVIGYFMWETDVIPRAMHRSLSLVDEVWTATGFVADAIRRVTDRPVHVTGHAVDVDRVAEVQRAELGIADDAFVVHFSFDANSTVARKNPNAAIDAFHRAFDGDPSAVFVLKVRNMQQAEHLARQGDPHAVGLMQRLADDPRIVLVTGEWTHARSLGLIEMADCFISLHRSEGYGYAIAEAMALGTPVVATDYSGNRDLLTAQEGWPVPAELVEVLPEEYFYWEAGMEWAEADVAQAARALQAVRSGEDVARRVNAAQTRAYQEASLDALQGRYLKALRPEART